MTEAELTAARQAFIADLRSMDWDYDAPHKRSAEYYGGRDKFLDLCRRRAVLPDGIELWNAYAPVRHKEPVPVRPAGGES